ncbi:DUF397 domain-containing protein [Nocardia brasiliensis]|uniref:DUF397 domain-containing protein n=1 Tax=Nocardia brasiliensis TaxID=37326 RepID=UPI0024570B63|nr:DUF397 domain-containing protein [Nocardia brasiliensis]
MSQSGSTGRRAWYKSSFSKDANSCVEVQFVDDATVRIRDSKYVGDPGAQPVISVPLEIWLKFLDVASGRVDCWPDGRVPQVRQQPGSGNTLVRDGSGTVLIFTPREWAAFVAGVRAEEFAA